VSQSGFRSHIDNRASSLTHSQVLSLNRVQPGGAQVAEEECRGAIRFGSQCHVENIIGGSCGSGQDNAIGFVACDIIDKDATCSSICYIAVKDGEMGRERGEGEELCSN